VQFDIRDFVDVQLDGKRRFQADPPSPRTRAWSACSSGCGSTGGRILHRDLDDLQKIAIAGHREFLARHGGVRPPQHDSFHMAIRPEMLTEHRDKWGVLRVDLKANV